MDRAVATKLALNSLIGARFSFGVASWFAPRPVAGALGLELDGQAPYLARVFAVRDVALALGAYGTTGEARRQWLLGGLLCDGADAVASIAAMRGGYLSARSGVGLTAFALSGVSLAAAVLSADQSGR